MERKHPHGGDSLVSCLPALHHQYGAVYSQVLSGDRTFTPDVFQHYNTVMPSDSVGPSPQYRQMGRQGCTDGASVGPEHSQEDGIRQAGSGSTRSQHRARHESCWGSLAAMPPSPLPAPPLHNNIQCVPRPWGPLLWGATAATTVGSHLSGSSQWIRAVIPQLP